MDDAELWSFFRSMLSQGGDIWLDHREKSHEEYSIRLDAAARERVKRFRAEFGLSANEGDSRHG